MNSFLQLLKVLEMEPLGVFTAAGGSVLSLFIINGNRFTWRRTAMILLAGFILGGYTLDYIEAKIIDEGESRALALIANILVGFIASDILSSVKSAAPTFTRALVDQINAFLKRFIGSSNNNN